MGRRVWGITATCILLLSAWPAVAQDFLDDQFVLLEPGLTVEVFQDAGLNLCATPGAPWSSFVCEGDTLDSRNSPFAGRAGRATDALGAVYQFRVRDATLQEQMDPVNYQGVVYEVQKRDSPFSVPTVIAHVPGGRRLCLYTGGIACTPCGPGPEFYQFTKLLNMFGDPINGHLYIALRGSTRCGGTNTIEETFGIIRISGLPTVFDVLNSYEPPSTLSFNIPLRPEGLDPVDTFDVYAGNLASLPDLTQATPIACDAASGAGAGERVSVADPLPDPPVGSPRYYLTSVSSGAQRRAGRVASGGQLAGRNSSLLPTCTTSITSGPSDRTVTTASMTRESNEGNHEK